MAAQSSLLPGAFFATFEDLKSAVFEWGKCENSLFVMGDSKKSKSKCRDDGSVIYEYLLFVCKQGGKSRPSRSRGLRPNQSTRKCGCPVKVRATASLTDGVLGYKITQLCLEHNHVTSELIYQTYPENRRRVMLTESESIADILQCPSISNNDLRHYVQELQDDSVVASDIIQNNNGQVTVTSLANELQSKFGEYSRKKKSVVIKSVEKGYPVALRELKKEGYQTITVEDSDSRSNTDSEVVEIEDSNIMNNMINTMYKKGQGSNAQGRPQTPTSANVSSKTPQSNSKQNDQWFIDRGGKIDLYPKRDQPSSDPGSKTTKKGKKRRRSPSPESGITNPLTENLIRKKKKQREPIMSTVTFAKVGGCASILEHLQERLQFLEYPELLPRVKGDLPKSFLLHGPTGCGKTLLANAIAGEYEVPLLSMTATELVGGISGDSEANIRDLFNQAASLAPCILFVDDVDAIASKRETASRAMESRVVTQLSNSMDELRSKNLPVLMICATNRPNSLDEAFRRTGRFDIEYALRFPNRDARKSILQAICQEAMLADDVSLSEIADLTPGYVGCDLKTLLSIANACALFRTISQWKKEKKTTEADSVEPPTDSTETKRKKLELTEEEIEKFDVKLNKTDFQRAMSEVKPTAKQEDVILVPNTSWEDIGGLDNIRKKLNLCIMERTKRPGLYQAIGMTSAAGVLLVGPPGCGKTSVARAVANEAGINFLYIKGAELLNKYVGESERNVRDLFKRANSLAPCIIFFDEIDSICPRRSSSSDDSSTSRVTNQLLLEMSGLEQRTDVYVIAATNRLDRLDRALLRPGRMDKVIYVGLPNPEGRVEILKALTKDGTRPNLGADVDLAAIGADKRCEGFSGADLGNLVQVARESCLEEIIESTEASEAFDVPVVFKKHFEAAFDSVGPSVDNESKRNYEAVKKLLDKKTAKKEMLNIDADYRAEARVDVSSGKDTGQKTKQ